MDDNSVLGILVGSWAKKDPQQAVEWTRQLTDEKLRANVLGHVVGDLAESDPQRAVGLLSDLPAASQPNVAGNLARAWMRSDRDAAVAWALQLPEDDLRKNVLSSVANSMAIQDLAKTAGWLEQLPFGKSRDWAVREFTSRAGSRKAICSTKKQRSVCCRRIDGTKPPAFAILRPPATMRRV